MKNGVKGGLLLLIVALATDVTVVSRANNEKNKQRALARTHYSTTVLAPTSEYSSTSVQAYRQAGSQWSYYY